MKIFMVEGITIGIVGALLGSLSGYTICEIIRRYKIIKLPEDIYYINALPVTISILDVLLVASVTTIICILATLYPSYKASRSTQWRHYGMSDPILRVSGLKKTFSKNGVEINVVKGIDIDIYEGDSTPSWALQGQVRAPFSTSLGPLINHQRGIFFSRSRNVKGFTEDEESRFRNEKIGFVFQFYHLLQDFNVIENITMPLLIKRLSPANAFKGRELS